MALAAINHLNLVPYIHNQHCRELPPILHLPEIKEEQSHALHLHICSMTRFCFSYVKESDMESDMGIKSRPHT